MGRGCHTRGKGGQCRPSTWKRYASRLWFAGFRVHHWGSLNLSPSQFDAMSGWEALMASKSADVEHFGMPPRYLARTLY